MCTLKLKYLIFTFNKIKVEMGKEKEKGKMPSLENATFLDSDVERKFTQITFHN